MSSPYVPQLDPDLARDATCAGCGRAFTQQRISEAWMDALATERPGAALLIARTIPDLWVPLHCPACERMQLALEAKRQVYAREGREWAA